MSFNDYWKAKAAKRRKAWAATARRFAEKHTQLEEIRKKVYLPLDYAVNFDFGNYKTWHFVKANPIVQWKQMNFCFSESGLRKALIAEGADIDHFEIKMSRKYIYGLEAPQPQNKWEQYTYSDNPRPNRSYDDEREYHAWLQRMYEICTEMETVCLAYRQVTMTIKRYSIEGVAFGYYELNLCSQLTKAAMLMQETDFNTLNVATLLMEMEAEWELRQEELNYYAKKLRLRTMEAAVATDEIEFTLWDDKKLAKKIEEYISKEYTINEVMDQLLRPYKAALNKYFDVAVERSLRDEVPTLRNFNYYSSNRDNFFEQELRPLLEAELDGVELEITGKSDKTITITYHGYQCCLHTSYNYSSQGIRLTPNVGYEKYAIPLSPSTPLSAIGGFVRQMPTINHRADEYIVKALHIYDKLMCQQNEEYNKIAQHLAALSAQHTGKPVGKLMKYLRWSAGNLLNKLNAGSRMDFHTIAVTGDTSFNYTAREMKSIVPLIYGDEFIKEKWIDAECSNVYSDNPEITDEQGWIKANRSRWNWKLREFAGHSCWDTFLTVDFINEKL